MNKNEQNRTPRISLFFLVSIFYFSALSFVSAQCQGPSNMSYLDNGVIKLGIDLNRGGSITYLSKASDTFNVVNSWDLGREIQQSYYSGPKPFGNSDPHWANWPWNPIGAGDTYCNPAKVVASKIITAPQNQKVLYVKTIPMQWALNNVPGECFFETWIQLKDNSAFVRCKLINHRSDKKRYEAYWQELPAVYTIGKLYRLFSYKGSTPYQNRPMHKINASFPWSEWKATEHWAALVDDTGWGLGVFNPSVLLFAGGFAGSPNIGGPADDPTGYISPVMAEIIDHNIRYEYTYALILGTLNEIRSFAVQNRPEERPNYRFVNDRQHFTVFNNMIDTGFPIQGKLRVKLEQDDPYMIGPEQSWQAKDVPRIFVGAAFHTKQSLAEIFWRIPGKDFEAARRMAFTIVPDGKFRIYEVNLSSHPLYSGTIAAIRFDPVPSGSKGEFADIYSISWKKQ